jgi:hypothetical protein
MQENNVNDETAAMSLAALAAEAFQAGAPKDQLAELMFDAGVCLSLEQVGAQQTIAAMLGALHLLSQEFPRAFAAVKFMLSTDTPPLRCGLA